MRDFNPKEYKVTALRDCPVPSDLLVCETPDHAAEYWRMHIASHHYFDPERECFVVLFLNVRKRVKGHQLVTIGTMDTMLVHPREVFRAAIVSCASAIVLMHNLCVAAHKLCYVHGGIMCSHRKECYANK